VYKLNDPIVLVTVDVKNIGVLWYNDDNETELEMSLSMIWPVLRNHILVTFLKSQKKRFVEQ
jgi:hypothetical protein